MKQLINRNHVLFAHLVRRLKQPLLISTETLHFLEVLALHR